MVGKDDVYRFIKLHPGVDEETIMEELEVDLVTLTELLRELESEGKIKRCV